MKACRLSAKKSAISATAPGPADHRAPRRRRRRASCLGGCARTAFGRIVLAPLRISVSSISTKPFSGERSGAPMARRSLAPSSHAVLYEPSPSCFCSCRAEMPLEWVTIGPEPDGQRELRAVHRRPGGDRRLLAAARALPQVKVWSTAPIPCHARTPGTGSRPANALWQDSTQAASSGKRPWNSGSERGKSVMTLSNQHVRFSF